MHDLSLYNDNFNGCHRDAQRSSGLALQDSRLSLLTYKSAKRIGMNLSSWPNICPSLICGKGEPRTWDIESTSWWVSAWSMWRWHSPYPRWQAEQGCLSPGKLPTVSDQSRARSVAAGTRMESSKLRQEDTKSVIHLWHGSGGAGATV